MFPHDVENDVLEKLDYYSLRYIHQNNSFHPKLHLSTFERTEQSFERISGISFHFRSAHEGLQKSMRYASKLFLI